MGRFQVVGATVVDGSGRDPGDVAAVTVEDGRITELGASSAHGERLDAGGLTMTPGLIDAHVHLGLSSLIQPQFSFQISAAEIAADIFATAGAALDAGFTTVGTPAGSTAVSSPRSRRARSEGHAWCRAGLFSARPAATATTGPSGSPPSCGAAITFLVCAPCP